MTTCIVGFYPSLCSPNTNDVKQNNSGVQGGVPIKSIGGLHDTRPDTAERWILFSQ